MTKKSREQGLIIKKHIATHITFWHPLGAVKTQNNILKFLKVVKIRCQNVPKSAL